MKIEAVRSLAVAFVRSFGLHKPYQSPCGQPVTIAEAQCTDGELAARLQLEKSTVSRLVRQMEAHDWIRRNSDRHDGRAVLILLTRQGQETATELAPAG